jgi:hypothetical protein
MTSKKQIADIENTIVLLEDKIERLEEEHVTMKQMISMQNSLIDNLQMIVKMMASSPIKHHAIHIGGSEPENVDNVQGIDQAPNTGTVPATSEDVSAGGTKQQQKNRISHLKHRMTRVF